MVLSGWLLLVQAASLRAQDVDACPSGWEDVVRAHLEAKLDRDFEVAASHLLEAEQQAASWNGSCGEADADLRRGPGTSGAPC